MKNRLLIYILILGITQIHCSGDNPSRTNSFLNNSSTDISQEKSNKKTDEQTDTVVQQPKTNNPDQINQFKSGNYLLEGKIQKGPFIQGTNVFVRELDSKLRQTGISFFTQTEDNTGLFRIDVEMSTPFAEIIATGPYFNEITGQVSDAIITLRAIVNLSESPVVNVNVLTDITRNRIVEIVKEGKTINEARIQAEAEVARFFGYNEEEIINFQTLDIAEDGIRNSALLAVSAITQQNHTASTLQEFLSKLGQDFKDNGKIDDENLIQKVKDNSAQLDLTQIRENLENRYLNIESIASIPSFENFIDTDGNGQINGTDDTQLVVIPLQEGDIISESDVFHYDIHFSGRRPTENILVNISHNLEDEEINLSSSQLTFTPDNFTTPQRVSLSFIDRFGNNRNNLNLNLSFETPNSGNAQYSYMTSEPSLFEIVNLNELIFSDESPFFVRVVLNETANNELNREDLIELIASSDDSLITDFIYRYSNIGRHRQASFYIIPNRNLSDIDSQDVIINIGLNHPHVIPEPFSFQFNQFQEPEYSFIHTQIIQSEVFNCYVTELPTQVNGNCILTYISENHFLITTAKTNSLNKNHILEIRDGNTQDFLPKNLEIEGHIDGDQNTASLNNIKDMKKLSDNQFVIIDTHHETGNYTLRIIDENKDITTFFTFPPDTINRSHTIVPLSNNRYYFIPIQNHTNLCWSHIYFLDLNLAENNQLHLLRDENHQPLCLLGSVNNINHDENGNIYFTQRDFDEPLTNVKKISYNPNAPLEFTLHADNIFQNESIYTMKLNHQNRLVILDENSQKTIDTQGNLLENNENIFHWSDNFIGGDAGRMYIDQNNDIYFLSISHITNQAIQYKLFRNEI